MRAIRVDQFLLIHNYRPDRWPAGTPDYEHATIKGVWYGDCDNGPTKSYIIDNQDLDEAHRLAYRLSFAKRPEFELYDLSNDPDQIHNVAGQAEYACIQQRLQTQLSRELLSSADPREAGQGDAVFDPPKYFGHGPRHPATTK
jgi:hypothetical protein